MQKKRILITGGAGFLGSHLALRLVKSCLVDVISSRKLKSQNPALRIHTLNLTQPEALTPLVRLLDLCDAACFFAARKPPQSNVYKANLSIDDLSAEAFARSACPRALYISGLAVVFNRNNKPVNEYMRIGPIQDPYLASKVKGEEMMMQAALATAKDCLTFRVNAPYGPGMPEHSVIMRFMRQALTGQNLTLYGPGERKQQFTWAGDAAEILALILELDQTTPQSGVYHFCGPDCVSMCQLAQQCIAICDSSSEIVTLTKTEGPTCPKIAQDRLEFLWPRPKRTNLKAGLYQLAEALRRRWIPALELFE